MASETILAKDTSRAAFYVVMSGAMSVTGDGGGSGSGSGDEKNEQGDDHAELVLKKGGYFGEDALMGTNESAKSTANIVAQNNGWCFWIDTATFRKVLGSYQQLTNKSKDKAILREVKLIKEANLEETMLNSLAEAVVQKSFKAKEVIQTEGDKTQAALYFVRHGSVTISSSSVRVGMSDKVIQAGECFGGEQLYADADGTADKKAQIEATYTATCNEDTLCKLLTLEECRLLINTFGGLVGGRKNNNSTVEPGSTSQKQLSKAISADDLTFELDTIESERRAIREFYNGFHTPVDQLPREKILGEGQFGQVWKVTMEEGMVKENFALKIQDLGEAIQNECLENIYRELKIISSLQHPFIVDLIDSKETGGKSFMLMTLCTGGELWSVVHRFHEDGSWESGIKEEDAKFYTLIVADTLAYMHRKNVLFRDLKPENVLLDETGYPNIIDFGFAKVTTEKTFTLCGTPNYMAPEIVLVSGHHVGADHWALGIMVYEMVRKAYYSVRLILLGKIAFL